VRRLRSDVDVEASRSNRRVQPALLPTIHPAEDVFRRLVAALYALEGAATVQDLDLEDLRRLVASFGSAVGEERFFTNTERRRWERFADRLVAVVTALEHADAASARDGLMEALGSFARA
jgi:hypothetical protein